MKNKALSSAQLKVLYNASVGQPLDTGIYGASEYGGWTRTLYSLRRAGLMAGDLITEAGRAALAAGSYPLTEKASS